MWIEFEDTAKYITVLTDDDRVAIRCDTKYTDIGDEETIDQFVIRHGGLLATFEYLCFAYKEGAYGL